MGGTKHRLKDLGDCYNKPIKEKLPEGRLQGLTDKGYEEASSPISESLRAINGDTSTEITNLPLTGSYFEDRSRTDIVVPVLSTSAWGMQSTGGGG
jgi:hypothetical protein